MTTLRFNITADGKMHNVEIKQTDSQVKPSSILMDLDGKSFAVTVVERDESSGTIKVKVNEKEYKVALGDKNIPNGKPLDVRINEAPFQIKVDTLTGTPLSLTEPIVTGTVVATKAEETTSKTRTGGFSVGGKIIRPPMPGKIISVKVSQGDTVKAGDVVLILEAMKMANEIASPFTGRIKEVRVSVGQSVAPEDTLLSIE
jgi:biotin carboxyl carrier protein